ncbi:SusD family protein [Chitinophaga costaii]|uniref:SusD family protein n=1 Tax=Chitinophaga costaii TaxID=1335309 RepID=A0A1C4DEY0_9BACT|nr:RagB/SusD family nutrient uptake outer membrane protein [Chitinophaga costaii]PUZ24599.1 RagB/SusD family nutrient uptake outer membrane protein [Chitinophaga costaii]SCC29927.1 SusD family protein [Chitinophaga costaii]
MKKKYIAAGILFVWIFTGCTDFLNQKSNGSLTVPNAISDAQGLLDDVLNINLRMPSFGEASADNYYLTTTIFDSFSGSDYVNLYTWGPDLFFTHTSNDEWTLVYGAVEKVNIALETLAKNKRTDKNAKEFDNARGCALFFRGFIFWKIACIWAKAYSEATKDQDLGIPLRLSSDYNIVSVRGTVSDTYSQVLKDLTEAVSLLPAQGLFVQRPSKAAAYGALAEVYLSMRQYERAGKYADSCLQLSNGLIDYNTISISESTPFPADNKEVIMYLVSLGIITNPYYMSVDSTLYRSYKTGDLRKDIFFQRTSDTTFTFKGSYGLDGAGFSGIATDEMYLVRAECYARDGKIDMAIEDLNTLLSKRFTPSTFVPVVADNAQIAINLVLAERRKELPFRDLRWIDIKRLNLEGANIALKRVEHGISYDLPPNDNRFALPLPFSVVNISGMKQNPR